MSCCGACKHWTPTEARAIVLGGTREQKQAAQMRAEELGLCLSFINRFPGAVDWLRGFNGPFWGKRPDLGYLTHADDGANCPAFEKIDA